MKKYLFVFILAVTVAITGMFCICGREVFAAVNADAAVSFSNPQAVAIHGDNLFVADIVEEEGEEFSLLHWIDNNNAHSFFTEKQIPEKVISLQATSDYLFLLVKNKIYAFDYASSNPTLKTFDTDHLVNSDNTTSFNISSFAVSGDYLFYYYSLQSENYFNAMILSESGFPVAERPMRVEYTARFLTPSTSQQGDIKVFYTNGENTKSVELCVVGLTNGQNQISEQYDSPSTLPEPLPEETTGWFMFGGELYFYSSTKWYNAKQGEVESEDYDCWSNGEGFLTKQIVASGAEIFVLCDYTTQTYEDKTNPYYQKPRVAKIAFGNSLPSPTITKSSLEYGASQIKWEIPDFSPEDIKMATVSGYPSNILYYPTRLEDDKPQFSPIEENTKLLSNAKILVVGQNQNGDLFICLDGKFGWIKYSDKVVYDTQATSLSLNAVTVLQANVFTMPFANEEFETTLQLGRLTAVTIKAKINGYALISFTKDNVTQYGFVLESCLGANKQKQVYTTYQRFAANPKAGQTLSLYATQQTDTIDNNQLLDSLGNPVAVKSGEEIRLYETLSDGTCFVGVLVDNVLLKGYIQSAELLKTCNKGLTNAQVLAIALFAIVLLVIVFVVILRIRAKNQITKEVKQTDLTLKEVLPNDLQQGDNFPTSQE